MLDKEEKDNRQKLIEIERIISKFNFNTAGDISDFDTLFWNTSETEKTHVLHKIIKLVMDEN